jgi:uncharacterized membrane protein
MADDQSLAPHILVRRWRVLLAAALGLAGFIAMRAEGFHPGLASLIAWNLAAATFVLTSAWLIMTADETKVRTRSGWEDENQAVTQTIIVSAVVAGFAATVAAMHESKGGHDFAGHWAWLFAVSSLLLGWLTVQIVFTLHYAHKYFGDDDANGRADRGVEFPGQAPTTYFDFLYMSTCIGISGQVSDFNITSEGFRRLVTFHALLAFFFNTTVLALGINILAGLIGQ